MHDDIINVLANAFRLVEVVLLDLEVGGVSLHLRVELYAACSKAGVYKCKFMEYIPVELREYTEPVGEIFSGAYIVGVDWGCYPFFEGVDFNCYNAETVENALNVALKGVRNHLDKISG